MRLHYLIKYALSTDGAVHWMRTHAAPAHRGEPDDGMHDATGLTCAKGDVYSWLVGDERSLAVRPAKAQLYLELCSHADVLEVDGLSLSAHEGAQSEAEPVHLAPGYSCAKPVNCKFLFDDVPRLRAAVGVRFGGSNGLFDQGKGPTS